MFVQLTKSSLTNLFCTYRQSSRQQQMANVQFTNSTYIIYNEAILYQYIFKRKLVHNVHTLTERERKSVKLCVCVCVCVRARVNDFKMKSIVQSTVARHMHPGGVAIPLNVSYFIASYYKVITQCNIKVINETCFDPG